MTDGIDGPNRRIRNAFGIAWVVGAAGAVMAPALANGWFLGPYASLGRFGLLNESSAAVGQNLRGVDQISQLIPWTTLAWNQVHQGHLPLWNEYSALGMPLAFNWQSATFSLPTMVSYLVPLHLAFTTQVLITLIIAGTGAYFLGYILKMGALACALAGTVYELSSAFMTVLGWPIASVMSWVGWLFAAVILVIRGGRRARNIAFLALTLALAIYAGQPDTLVVLVLGVALLAIVLILLRLPLFGGSGPILRPAGDLIVASIAGLAIGSPLALPGLQVASESVRSAGHGAKPNLIVFSIDNLRQMAFAGLNGHGITEGAYLGILIVVLAVAAVVLRRRQPEVIALFVVAVVMAAITYVRPVAHALNIAPGLQAIKWTRASEVMALSIAVFAGLGMDLLIRSFGKRSVAMWIGSGFVIASVFLIGLWIAGAGHLSPLDSTSRTDGLLWATAETVLGLLGIGLIVVVQTETHRGLPDRGASGRSGNARSCTLIVAGSWLACATAFLVVEGGPIWSSSPSYLTATPAVTKLQRAVGSSLIGYGAKPPEFASGLGVRRDANIMFGVDEMSVIDPMLPRTYFRSWTLVTGKPGDSAGYPPSPTYSPLIPSVTIARTYGVGFVLEGRGQRAPVGAVFDTNLGDEALYRIPDSGAATLTPLLHDGAFPPTTAIGQPLPVTHPNPESWRLITNTMSSKVLRLHLTDSPGWHATIDGRPLVLSAYAGVMLQARIPSGHHLVVLNYWPDTFTFGLIIASVAATCLAVSFTIEIWRRRHSIRE